MTRIVVLGGGGMLGHKMFQILRMKFPDTWCTVHGSLSQPLYENVSIFHNGQVLPGVDAMCLDGLVGLLQELSPDVVVNCIGVIKQRKEAQAAIPCITLNALLPHRLSECCRDLGCRLIHFSTDCVFDGRIGGYTEGNISTAEDLYGQSKYIGELSRAPALTLRTSIIGREIAHFKSLLEWFLSKQGGVVRGYTRVIYSGVTTNYMAELVGQLLVDHPTLTGLYQVASPPITKYNLLCLLRDAYKLTVEILPDDKEVCDRSMCGDRFLEATHYAMPTWPALIDQLSQDTTPYDQWRA